MNNRIIKFRAWDKGDKKMYYQFQHRDSNRNTKLEYDAEYHDLSVQLDIDDDERRWTLEDDDLVLMQFTGLLDRHGKEIYEGDVVGKEGVYHFIEREGWGPAGGEWKIIGEKQKNFTGEKEEKYIAGYLLKAVEWKERSCGFEPFSDSEENCGHCGGASYHLDYEVIGNVFDNPDLLTNKP